MTSSTQASGSLSKAMATKASSHVATGPTERRSTLGTVKSFCPAP